MSADNWGVCPKCLKKAREEHAAVLRTIDESSRAGVSESMLKAARAGVKPVNKEDYREFREEYEFFVTEAGVVEASFSGSCTVCGLSVNFNCEHPIPDMQETGENK